MSMNGTIEQYSSALLAFGKGLNLVQIFAHTKNFFFCKNMSPLSVQAVHTWRAIVTSKSLKALVKYCWKYGGHTCRCKMQYNLLFLHSHFRINLRNNFDLKNLQDFTQKMTKNHCQIQVMLLALLYISTTLDNCSHLKSIIFCAYTTILT